MAAAALFLFGYAHMAKLGFGSAQFFDSIREYALLCTAGAMFGWLLTASARGYKEKFLFSDDSSMFPVVETLGVLSPVVFLIVLHQFRYFLNDGPANISMGLVLLVNAILSGGRKRGDSLKIEAGTTELKDIMDRFRNEGYSAEVIKLLAQAHKKRGNYSKARLIEYLMKKTINNG